MRLKTLALAIFFLVPPGLGVAQNFSQSTKSIVGGIEGTKPFWPSLVAVMVQQQAVDEQGLNNFIQICTGAVVAPNKILTAGHCAFSSKAGRSQRAKPEEIIVLVGANNVNFRGGDRTLSTLSSDANEALRVAEVAVHEQYEGPDRAVPFDFAVLTLETSTTATPARLAPPSSCALASLPEVDFVTAVGYGANTTTDTFTGTGIFRELPIEVLDANCVGSNKCLKDREIFAAGFGNTNPAAGDSGSPLFVETEEGQILVGVMSREEARRNGEDLPEDVFSGPDAAFAYGRTDAAWDFILDNVDQAQLDEEVCVVESSGCNSSSSSGSFILLLALSFVARLRKTTISSSI